LATIFSFEKSRKWIILDGLTGISRSGSGAPIASGWKKSLGFLKLFLASRGCAGNLLEAGGRRLRARPIRISFATIEPNRPNRPSVHFMEMGGR
jgi:hypothetical protein